MTEMTAAEQIMEKKKLMRAELNKQTRNGDELWKKSTEKLGTFLKEYDSLSKGERMHTNDRIFPAAAVYLTVKAELGEKKAYAVVENAAIKGCAGTAKKLEKTMKIPGMRGLFVKLWNPLTKKIFGSSSGFKNVFYPKEKGAYRMDVTSCPYFRHLTELGCPELTKIFCENDERVYGNLPGLKFERTGTLGKGAKCCDFYLKKI